MVYWTQGLYVADTNDVGSPWVWTLYVYGVIKLKMKQCLKSLPLKGKVAHEVGRMRWKAAA